MDSLSDDWTRLSHVTGGGHQGDTTLNSANNNIELKEYITNHVSKQPQLNA